MSTASPFNPISPRNHLPQPIVRPSRSKFGFISFMPENFFSFALVYGGYLTSIRLSIQAGVVVTLRRCVKASKEALPR